MAIIILIVEFLLGVGVALFLAATILAFLKSLKKDHFPQWKFLDYFSVGYLEHLYIKYIKEPITQKKVVGK
ncbi:MAG: hypothetical protein ACXVAY_06240 [Mucilaginibacter sp.]